MRKKVHYEMDMTNGPLLGKIIRFSMPLMLTSVLQLFYNAADVVVVGRFASSAALAAVSSTGSLINLIVNVFMGLSLGASVTVAQAYGAGNHKEVSDTVHTTISMAVVCGVVVSIIGICFGKPILKLMDTPDEVLELSGLYVTLYFSGSIFNMLYNFGAAILRAVGDTRRPMYYLILSGLVNVVLNVIFVVGFHMSVAGVALATVASQVLSAVLVIICLMRTHGSIHLDLRRLRIVKEKALSLIKIGLPAGFQGAIFSISNVLIQASVNSFGADAMAGNGAAANIEGFIYVAMNTFYTAAVTFTSQNLGARKVERLGRIMWLCQGCVVATGLTFGMIARVFSPQLLSIYSPDWNVIQMGMVRNNIITVTYFICGVMDVFVGGIRGLGSSITPMIISLLGACALRVVWIYTVFAAYRSLPVLYISYPISWTVTAIVQCICYIIVKNRAIKRIRAEDALGQT